MENQRSKIILLTIYLCFIFILGRLFYWQIIKGQELRDKSLSQIYKLDTIIPQQGHILSSDSYPLSLDYSYYRLAIYKPNLQKELPAVIDEINKIKPEFASENAVLLEKFKNSSQKWLEFNSPFDYEQMLKLQKIGGLDFQLKQQRYYPEKTLAKNLINNLELFYKRRLKGQSGFIRTVVDGSGQNLLTKKNWKKNEIDGQNIKLSLNRQIQFQAEKLLEQGVETYQADAASLIVIDSKSGQILSIASFEASPSSVLTKIPNISDLFEPGSIFKPLVVSMALDTNSINTSFICTQCNRPRQIGEYTINNWNDEVHPDSTLKDIIKNSDNIGMSYIIDRLGLSSFSNYFHRLKLDQKSGVELVGESVSPLKTSWPDIDLATASFGQGFAINQLQVLQAFNTLANQGKLVNLHLNQETLINTTPIFKTETVNSINEILKYAVENSPVASLKPKDLEVCAKSGTAQVAVKGSYTDSSTIGSYIGFAPCHDPKFTMIVTVNNPRSSPWGSSTAAPMWFEMAEKINSLL